MGEITGFLKYDRRDFPKQPVEERVKHFREFYSFLSDEELALQGARCMDCGVPFCQNGCPINNIIPDWNDLVYRNRWEEAIERLHKTNNFPEFTGRVCPAPCEHACVLAINAPAVTIKNIELSIIEKAYARHWIKPQPPKHRYSARVAVIGSGPAGLACADELNKKGYHVTVFEKNEACGGLLRFGIPDFKLEKWVIDRRLKRMEQEGVRFKTKVHVGVDVKAAELLRSYDVLVLAGGAEQPRDLAIPGRRLKGIHFAMEYLTQQNRIVAGARIPDEERITAAGKTVLVLGGGDTGSDCIGTANRQGAKRVINFELLPRPPKERAPDNPWPYWAYTDRMSTSHEEGCEREFAVLTKEFLGDENGHVRGVRAVRLKFGPKDPETGRRPMEEIPGSEFEVEAQLVLLALGFLGPVRSGLLEELGVELDARGNVRTNPDKMTSVPGVFAAGDMRRGQSLVVWAIHEGRTAAEGVHRYLQSVVAVG